MVSQYKEAIASIEAERKAKVFQYQLIKLGIFGYGGAEIAANYLHCDDYIKLPFTLIRLLLSSIMKTENLPEWKIAGYVIQIAAVLFLVSSAINSFRSIHATSTANTEKNELDRCAYLFSILSKDYDLIQEKLQACEALKTQITSGKYKTPSSLSMASTTFANNSNELRELKIDNTPENEQIVVATLRRKSE
jgi:hypothetical protein